MASDRFNPMIRRLTAAPTRRGVAGLLAAGALTVAGWQADMDSAAKSRKKTCKPKCDKACAVCKKGKCKAVKDGTSCKRAGVCEDGECVALRCGNGGTCTVFVTSEGKVGSEIGGLAGGNAFCQNLAEAAGLTGMFRAWLSEDASPSNQFTNRAKAGPYFLVPNDDDGADPPPKVADSFADLTSCDGSGVCLQNAINRTEEGVERAGNLGVWTGTLADGTPGPESCEGFTAGGDGLTGVVSAVNGDWTNLGIVDCALNFTLYCFEQAT